MPVIQHKVLLYNPFLYCLANEDEKSVAVAYFNCAVDGIDETEVTFARDVKNVRVIGGTGEQIDARIVKLFDIRSFGYVCIEADYE